MNAPNLFGFTAGLLADLAQMPMFVAVGKLFAQTPVGDSIETWTAAPEAAPPADSDAAAVDALLSAEQPSISWREAAATDDGGTVRHDEEEGGTALSMVAESTATAEAAQSPANANQVFTSWEAVRDFDGRVLSDQPFADGEDHGAPVLPGGLLAANTSTAPADSGPSVQRTGQAVESGSFDHAPAPAAANSTLPDVPALAPFLSAPAPLAAQPPANAPGQLPSAAAAQQPSLDGNALLASVQQQGLRFETNVGQFDAQYDFVARGSGFQVALNATGSTMAVFSGNADASPEMLRMELVGGNAHAAAVGQDQMPGLTNYLSGNPAQNHTSIVSYAQAAYQDVYNGVDVVYHSSADARQLEYDFVVAPHADSGQIALAFPGADGMVIDAQGELMLHTAAGDVVQHQPVAYQVIAGVRQDVASHFTLGEGGNVQFAVGAYDTNSALVIDPSYAYLSYLGGDGNDRANGVAFSGNPIGDPDHGVNFRPSGTVFVAGDTASLPVREPGVGSV